MTLILTFLCRDQTDEATPSAVSSADEHEPSRPNERRAGRPEPGRCCADTCALGSSTTYGGTDSRDYTFIAFFSHSYFSIALALVYMYNFYITVLIITFYLRSKIV